MEPERRLDKLEEQTAEIKEVVYELKSDLKLHMVTSAANSTETQTVLAELKPIIEEYNFEKILRRKRKEAVKEWSGRLTFLSIIGGIIGTLYTKFFSH